jgi:hypothetical protein
MATARGKLGEEGRGGAEPWESCFEGMELSCGDVDARKRVRRRRPT